MMRTVIMEELPEPHKLKKFTTLYLIPESLVCIYLLFCLVYFDKTASETENYYRNPIASFVFFCTIPFMSLRIISLLCCMSLQMIPCQILWIWSLNLIVYAAWSIYAMCVMITKEGQGEKFSIEFFNTVLLLLVFCTSVCGVICGLPLFIYKLYERATQDKYSLSRKVGQIKLLPRVRYNTSVHTSMIFCTICTENFSNNRSSITYLPCDPRHYFHS